MIILRSILAVISVLVIIGCATMKGDWQNAEKQNTVQSYQEFLREHPDSEFSLEAIRKVEELEWNRSKRKDTIDSYESFFKKYPDSRFTSYAKDRIVELKWDRTKQQDSIKAYQSFLNEYPASKYEQQAKETLEELEWKATQESKTIEAYEKFLKKHPSSRFASQAASSLNSMREILNADTVHEIEVLIDKYRDQPDVTEPLVKKVEDTLVKEIQTSGPANRLVLNLPKPSYSDGTIDISCDEEGRCVTFVLMGKPGEPIITMTQNPTWCVIHFIGEVPMGENNIIIGEGKSPYMLSFAFIRDIGYVYLRGKGLVVMANRRKVKLGY